MRDEWGATHLRFFANVWGEDCMTVAAEASVGHPVTSLAVKTSVRDNLGEPAELG